MRNTFKVDDLIKIAKRENNTKRSYLYVNPIQGKHIPVDPFLSLELFSQLARIIENRYINESVLIIGFAETATAIGAAIAYEAKNCKFYLNTTREDIPNVEYLFFTESHSHATEQKLVINGLEECLNEVDRIVFAEDEVTTGNTIEKIIRILQNKYSKNNLRFGIISVLNSMSTQRIQDFHREEIVCDYVYHIPTEYRVDEIYRRIYKPLRERPCMESKASIIKLQLGDYWNSRMISSTESIRKRVDGFVQNVIKRCKLDGNENNILILGTEECMFPGMVIGNAIKRIYFDKHILFHATTRSPIEVCDDEDYPLHNRMPLESIYGENRRTFIYNLRKYDKVLIVTDANKLNKNGLISICAALEYYSNKNIMLVQWGDDCDEEQLF